MKWLAVILVLAAAPALAETCTEPDGGRYHVRLYSGKALAVNPDWEMRIRHILEQERRAPHRHPADPMGCPGNPLVVEEFRFAFGHNLGGDFSALGWRPYWMQVTAEPSAVRGLSRSQFEITCETHPETREEIAGVTVCRVPRDDAPRGEWPAVFRFGDIASADGAPLDVNCEIGACRGDLLMEEGLTLSWSLQRPRPDDGAFIALNRRIVEEVRGWRVPANDLPDLRADPLFATGQ